MAPKEGVPENDGRRTEAMKIEKMVRKKKRKRTNNEDESTLKNYLVTRKDKSYQDGDHILLRVACVTCSHCLAMLSGLV